MEDSIRDELAIRELVARYAATVGNGDVEGWSRTWAEDGEWEVLGQTSRGREAVTNRLEELLGGLEFVVQMASGGILEIRGDQATGYWQITEHGRFAGGNPLFTLGAYRDRYVRVEGDWRFARRGFHAIYVGPPDMSAKATPPPVDF
ncbi:MAG: nuclear transport factor 2 family protein [Myxococcota bacterium]|nr:nuclear transport factor 2 family protein [Myxococcota bacterium]